MTRKFREYLLFDIDGTVLDAPAQDLRSGLGLQFLECLKQLADKRFYFVFITGNDFDLQKERILAPIADAGLGSSVFCFSDGGSRAFEYNRRTNDFEYIPDFSESNIIGSELVDNVREAFHSLLPDFVSRHPWLSTPSILLSDRTLDYLDLRIAPLRPDFLNDQDAYGQFKSDIEKLAHRPEIKNTTFELIDQPDGLLLRAHGRSPEVESDWLRNMIRDHLLTKPEYADLGEPIFLERGGKVTCQIALKPFNYNESREAFRQDLEDAIQEDAGDTFEILLGGRTTVDIQLHGVNKDKAIRFFEDRLQATPEKMIYFGNEFREYGNDLPVALMPDDVRPGCIINVGKPRDVPLPAGRLIEQGKGPISTVNYLEFLLFNC